MYRFTESDRVNEELAVLKARYPIRPVRWSAKRQRVAAKLLREVPSTRAVED